jgi:hypothetical protein
MKLHGIITQKTTNLRSHIVRTCNELKEPASSIFNVDVSTTTLTMTAAGSSEILVMTYKSTRRQNPDHIFNLQFTFFSQRERPSVIYTKTVQTVSV